MTTLHHRDLFTPPELAKKHSIVESCFLVMCLYDSHVWCLQNSKPGTYEEFMTFQTRLMHIIILHFIPIPFIIVMSY